MVLRNVSSNQPLLWDSAKYTRIVFRPYPDLNYVIIISSLTPSRIDADVIRFSYFLHLSMRNVCIIWSCVRDTFSVYYRIPTMKCYYTLGKWSINTYAHTNHDRSVLFNKCWRNLFFILEISNCLQNLKGCLRQILEVKAYRFYF